MVKKAYYVKREIIINASLNKVFDYVKNLKIKTTYSRNGNKKAGEGEPEIKSIAEREKIETAIRFLRTFCRNCK